MFLTYALCAERKVCVVLKESCNSLLLGALDTLYSEISSFGWDDVDWRSALYPEYPEPLFR